MFSCPILGNSQHVGLLRCASCTSSCQDNHQHIEEGETIDLDPDGRRNQRRETSSSWWQRLQKKIVPCLFWAGGLIPALVVVLGMQVEGARSERPGTWHVHRRMLRDSDASNAPDESAGHPSPPPAATEGCASEASVSDIQSTLSVCVCLHSSRGCKQHALMPRQTSDARAFLGFFRLLIFAAGWRTSGRTSRRACASTWRGGSACTHRRWPRTLCSCTCILT